MAGWYGTGLAVLLYDTYAIFSKRDTMSTAARRHPYVVGLAVTVFMAHLWPPRRWRRRQT